MTYISMPLKSSHRDILEALNRHGFEAYVVGGAVRDYIAGRGNKDVDITTSATPDEVRAVFPNAELVGAHFGVSLVKTGGETVEVATFRNDGVYRDGRHPESVAYTTSVIEDLKRRDFTMNALLANANGIVIDMVGGIDDIRTKTVRAIGDPVQRFSEDALRMLRAIRFACKLGFSIDPATLDGIREHAHTIHSISQERIAEELSRILTSGRAAEGVELLDQTNLLRLILPEIDALKGCPQNPVWHPEGDVFVHTLGLLRQLDAGCSLTLALAALLHDVGKPLVLEFTPEGMPTQHGHDVEGAKLGAQILSRLKFSTEVRETVCAHIDQHMVFTRLSEMRMAKQVRFVRQPAFPELLALHKLDCMSSRGDLTAYDYASSLLNQTPAEVLRPERLITGNDLIKIGLKPGPAFRRILAELESLQIEGQITTREEALSLALTL